MNIIVNGKETTLEENASMQTLITTLKLEGKVMAAAVNMNIVKQDVWDSHILVSGDKVELLDFVGGG
ncbi:MAG TPA: sulfur carrier protein ThiS [Helicobacteraceae bacterium]|nr:sulfur carrier protein ThiS [Helicobacteraceae bacterium]